MSDYYYINICMNIKSNYCQFLGTMLIYEGSVNLLYFFLLNCGMRTTDKHFTSQQLI